MICDNCKKRESVISFTKVEGSNVTEVHLCRECATEKLNGNLFMLDGVKEFFKELFGPSDSNVEVKRCRSCNTSLSDVIETSQVGCSYCYDEFRTELENFLRNYQLSQVHKGKIPLSSPTDLKIGRRILDLNESLQEAIALENYEEAAKIRDELKGLRKKR